MFLRIILFLSSVPFTVIEGVLIVKIIRNSYYAPDVPCTFLRNISHSRTLQDCIWSCENEVACHTAVYFNNEQRCSLFAEPHTIGQIKPAKDIRASVIAYKKNPVPNDNCLATTNSPEETTTNAPEGTTSYPLETGSVCSLFTHEERGAVHWTFDNHASTSSSSNVSAQFVNNATCTVPGIRGYGAALLLSARLQQHVIIDYEFNLNHTNFTITVWINYRADLNDMGIVGQCEKRENSLCLHLNIRKQKAFLGFYGNDLESQRTLVKNRWYHLAFIFNHHSNSQLIYLDGILSDLRKANGPYLGKASRIELGRGSNDANVLFDGLIDRVSLLNRVMSDDEILEQATLVVYYSFNQSIDGDSSPNQIIASAVNVSLTAGTASQSLLFNLTDAYFQVRNLVLLADTGRSHSYSFWIYPVINQTNLTLIHVISSGDWCSPIIGFDAYQQLVVPISNETDQQLVGPRITTETWTHIALVYEKPSQLTLDINGSMRCQRKSYSYATDQKPLTLIIGKNINYKCCSSQPGQFRGKIDEFRLYARSLNSSDVEQLAAH